MTRSQPKPIIAMDVAERETLLARAAESGLAVADVERIRAVFESYAYVSELLDQKNLSLARLRKMLFGDRTETSANVLGTERRSDGTPAEQAAADERVAEQHEDNSAANSRTAKPRRGHGRNGADDLPGAARVSVRVAATRAKTCGRCCGGAPRNCRRRSRCATRCRATIPTSFRPSSPIAWRMPAENSSK